jgi:NAD(P)-dependent dehydrogenase (short-subunit alcohol dehydrogenase family)
MLVEKGCSVLIADIGLRPEAQAFIDSTTQKGGSGPTVFFERTDVTDWSQLQKAFDVAKEKFGTVPDLICPGAGIYEPVRTPYPWYSVVCFELDPIFHSIFRSPALANLSDPDSQPRGSGETSIHHPTTRFSTSTSSIQLR